MRYIGRSGWNDLRANGAIEDADLPDGENLLLLQARPDHRPRGKIEGTCRFFFGKLP